MSKPIYNRILLKLSGEALQGEEGFGIDPSILDRMALEIKELIEMGVEVGVVIGGGNLFRGAKLAKAGMNRVVGDHMGMLATVMNGLAMRDALHRADVNAKLMSAFQLNGICDTYNWSEAIKMLREKRVVIFSAGTGSPFFTTDSAACLRGIEIEADVVLKATKVDGVYDKDPVRFSDAKKFNTLRLQQAVERPDIKVMDKASIALAADYKLPLVVCKLLQEDNLVRAASGEHVGTRISAE